MNSIVGSGVPFDFDYINLQSSRMAPNTVHLKDNQMFNYFRKYLIQKAMSVYEWTLPENWSREYFLYILYCWGFLAVINTDKFGIIPQGCGLAGYDVFYRPSHVTIANPLIKIIKNPQIGKDTEVIKLMPNYGSPLDIIDYYASILALTSETAITNVQNSKLSYVFGAKNKTMAESFKKMFDNIQSGEPAVFIDKDLFNDDGSVNWQTFTQNLKQNYIATDLLNDMKKWLIDFDTIIGIPNSGTEKKERLISDEVNANNSGTKTISELWFDTLKDSLCKVRKMFGYSENDLSVRKRDFLGSTEECINNSKEVTE